MIDELLAHRLIAVLGKGGVGRTTVSAAIGAAAAARALRTLIIEADMRAPIAQAYGHPGAFASVELSDNLYEMTLGGQESLEEYLSFVVPRPILRMVFASSFYQYFVHAAPAVRELTMMGKVFHEIERRAAPLEPWNVVVFDAPASGQALSMIRMPFAARETFGASVAGREAGNIAALLRDPAKCAIAAVTTAEPLAIAETLEINRTLAALGLKLAAVFFNRMSAAAFDAADIARMVRRAARDPDADGVAELAAIARAELQRRMRDRRALAMLRRSVKCRVIELVECRGLAGRALTAQLAAQFGGRAPRRTGPGEPSVPGAVGL
ncbi:MAG TPA: ArsA-related P-loop ATPase [Candidatus Binataceae bacterium]|nr:ArsA-related P-loop ATPase [Candidatus Binataceae bacterium]